MALKPPAKSPFIERLKTYGIGVGIGLVLSGMLLYARWQMHQQQKAQGSPSQQSPAAPAAPSSGQPSSKP